MKNKKIDIIAATSQDSEEYERRITALAKRLGV